MVATNWNEPPTVIERSVLFRETPVTATLSFFTVIVQVAVLLPSSVVTVIFASPSLTAVTLPLPSTVAIFVLSDFHVTFLLVAFSGATVATNVTVPPTVSVCAVLSSLTPVTATLPFVTVTLQVAVLLPSSVVTVIFASPSLTPFTLPLASTVAISVLSDFHVTFLLVAPSGETVATNVSVPPTVSERVVLSSLTPVTATFPSLTVTLQVAVLPPSSLLTVTTVSPTL